MLIPRQAQIAKPSAVDIRLSSYLGVLHRTLVQEFVRLYTILRGLNGRGVDFPLATTSYAVADLPDPVAGGIIYVSNEAGGAVLAFGDGTNWRRSTDRAIVS
jgi:hypothetical protein